MAEPTRGTWQYDDRRGELLAVDDGFAVPIAFLLPPGELPYSAVETHANGRTMAAGKSFLTACTRERDTVPALDWLSALLDQCERNFAGLLGEDGDQQALQTAFHESCGLLTDLRAAVVQARGEALNG